MSRYEGVTLSTRDLEGVLAFVSAAYDADAEPLTTELLDRLAELVGCDYATYQAYDWRRRVVTAYVRCSNEDPLAVPPPYVPESYWNSMHAYRARAALDKLSDRFDRRERERMRDEEEFNAEFRIVDSLGVGAGNKRTRSAWLHFESQGRDFDERDRELVLALRPHLDALWRRAVSRRQVAELLAALGRDGDTAPAEAIVVFEGDGRIQHATAEAERLLAAWFRTADGRLPLELQDWVTLASPGNRYTEHRNGSMLVVEATGEFTLILHERASGPAGVTPREREVLGLVAEGLSNTEIARALSVAPSTVAKHLEHAYAKLGAHSRTAAVARLAKLSE